MMLQVGFRTSVGVVAILTALATAATSSVSGRASERPQDSDAKRGKPPTVLFLCPHGAAKSVLASAYFQRAAKERGLNVRVDSAGTEPDEQVSSAVASHLTKNGYAIPIAKPRKVTSADLAAADVIISIGCDLKNLPGQAPANALRKWDEVPAPSEDFARADDAIKKRVMDLVEELVRKQQTSR
jgi:arsenate reductase (thioredoxin)